MSPTASASMCCWQPDRPPWVSLVPHWPGTWWEPDKGLAWAAPGTAAPSSPGGCRVSCGRLWALTSLARSFWVEVSAALLVPAQACPQAVLVSRGPGGQPHTPQWPGDSAPIPRHPLGPERLVIPGEPPRPVSCSPVVRRSFQDKRPCHPNDALLPHCPLGWHCLM